MTTTAGSYTLILSASNRPRSRSLGLARRVEQELIARDQPVVLADLAERLLPFHNPADHHALELSPDEQVRSFARLAGGAHALVWVTPIYHGTFSGMLKNALDNLNIPLMARKPVFLMANGGGRFGGAVFDHMRTMVVNLHAVAVNCQVLALGSDFTELPDGGYLPVEEQLLQRITRGVDELCGYIRVFATEPVQA